MITFMAATISPLHSPSITLKPSPSPPPKFPGGNCNCNSQQPPSTTAVHRRRSVVASVAFNPQGGNFDTPLLDDDDNNIQENPPAPMPPTPGRFEVFLDAAAVRRLDLAPFQSATAIADASSVEPGEYMERTIGFTINYERDDPYDQRELSELPDVRLWFVQLDAAYPWLPVLLDWRAGELARYAAMLVPHQMSTRMGVVFNPEALELFIMNKVFTVYSWLKHHGIPPAKARSKTKDMARMLGFGIGDELFDLIDHES